MEFKRVQESFYLQSTLDLAKSLIGRYLIHTVYGEKLIGQISETEAYLGVLDRACHSYGRKRTKRTAVLFREPGLIYTYTMHTHCLLNVVAESVNQPEAVLIRAIKPISGMERMEALRGKSVSDRQFSNGPGKLTQAMAITMDAYGQSLIDGPLFVAEERGGFSKTAIVKATKRIGIQNTRQASQFPFRFIME